MQTFSNEAEPTIFEIVCESLLFLHMYEFARRGVTYFEWSGERTCHVHHQKVGLQRWWWGHQRSRSWCRRSGRVVYLLHWLRSASQAVEGLLSGCRIDFTYAYRIAIHTDKTCCKQYFCWMSGECRVRVAVPCSPFSIILKWFGQSSIYRPKLTHGGHTHICAHIIHYISY